jgi:hypothetical protein
MESAYGTRFLNPNTSGPAFPLFAGAYAPAALRNSLTVNILHHAPGKSN